MAKPADTEPDVILNERQAEQVTGLSARTLQRLRAEGGGPPYIRLTTSRIGYSRRALADWTASRTFKSTADEAVRAAQEARA